MRLTQESSRGFLSVRRDLLLRAKKPCLRLLEAVYFCFFLPLSAYEAAGTQALGLSLFVLFVAVTQLLALLGRRLTAKRFTGYAVFLRSAGYWRQAATEGLAVGRPAERVEWTPRSDPQLIAGKTLVRFQDAYYRRVQPETAGWIDRLVLRLASRDDRTQRVCRLLLLGVALSQLALARLFFFDWAALLQLLGYLLLLG